MAAVREQRGCAVRSSWDPRAGLPAEPREGVSLATVAGAPFESQLPTVEQERRPEPSAGRKVWSPLPATPEGLRIAPHWRGGGCAGSHLYLGADGAAAGPAWVGADCAPPRRPLERGWRKQKEGGPVAPQPKVRLRQEVVSTAGQRRGQRIAMPVRKFFAREKRPYGLGMVGRLTNRTYRKRIDSYVKRQIEDMDDHRWGRGDGTEGRQGSGVGLGAPGWSHRLC